MVKQMDWSPFLLSGCYGRIGFWNGIVGINLAMSKIVEWTVSKFFS
ncbi:hypothetical protein H8R29_17535 [Priestia megaterium]|nr:hypothetical protein [Priestia megaterium]MED3809612.1 hypothetical protein [Priestia megaterium]MED4397380.1 hypothetical protein [Priestia megaterium]MED4737387.1 hypothetical protein [Priestia megaterium]NMM59118.1 hypothetical protein [Priestia megaterium]QSF26113.1 hypothetical protein H8R29_17535 [Priestia megaterium]